LLRVLNALGDADCRPRRSGAGYSARCPAHDDTRPSLSVGEGDDGRVLLHCQAGCTFEAILAALKLDTGDLFAPKQARPAGAEVVATYDYTDEKGALLFQVVRYASKAFKQRRPDGAGGWLWNLKDVPRVLYRLPDVLDAMATPRTVFVAEGERDCDALAAAGETATCNPMGAGKWRPEHARVLYGAAEVVVVADRDEPGRAHAQAVAESLAGHVGHLLIVEALAGKDAADHLGAGHRVDDLQTTYDDRDAGVEDCSTAVLLKEICEVLHRFVVWPGEPLRDFVALWILHTYVFDLFDTTPYLDVSSAAKRSGKTRLLEILAMLVARPWPVVEASEAVLFRKVDRDRPTLLIDEIDATFGKDSKVTEGLRAIYNAGYRVGAKVPRCVGNNHEPTDFDVYCPKAFAGLNGLPDTVKDRSGRIELRRRARSEPKPERLRLSRARAELAPLAGRLRQWATSVEDQLRDADPALPDELSDRAQDGSEVLAAIAELAGEEWPERARVALVAVMGGEEEHDFGVILLGHIRDAFDHAATRTLDGSAERMTTADLLVALVGRGDESPWAGWWGNDIDAGVTRRPAMRLAQMLKAYGIHPTTMRLAGGSAAKGYDRADFGDAWDRYVPA
jgi:hypothetical protein